MRSSRLTRMFAVAAAVFAAGCADEVPTALDPALLPGGRPVTIQVTLEAEDFLEPLGQFTGFSDPRNAAFLLVANEFDGALFAHTLARLSGFPATVSYTAEGASRTDSVFSYIGGRLVAPVDTAASVAEGPVTLQLWSLAQEWDVGSVSWQFAIDTTGMQVPWAQPGGTPGRLLAELVRTPGDTLTRDSLVWQLDSLAVREIAEPNFPGLLITADGAPARLELRQLALRADVRPEGNPDTTLVQTVSGGVQRFVFTPDPPITDEVWEVGGLFGPRTLFRIRPPTAVPACEEPAESCGTIPLDRVTLNEAALLLDPLLVPGGFRPLEPALVRLVVVGEPELGRLAPLGQLIASELAEPTLFATSIPSDAVALRLTSYIRRIATADTVNPTALALLGSAQASSFGIARFSPTPRLRLVYTLPSGTSLSD